MFRNEVNKFCDAVTVSQKIIRPNIFKNIFQKKSAVFS